MALYGAFSNSVLGMMSQSHALHNIGTNVANVNTGGYKRVDTAFSTILSRSYADSISDVGGVKPQDVSTVAQQGNIVASSSATDVAIAGKGFFALNSEQDGSGTNLFTRDGSFGLATVNDITVTGIGGTNVSTKDGYLVDKNGYFVQGWPYVNGSVTTTGSTQSLRVDQYAFSSVFEATTSGTLGLNLSASDSVGDTRTYDITMIDSGGNKQSDQLTFTKTDINAWNMTHTTSQDPVAQVNTVTLGGTVGEVGDNYSVVINGTTISYTTDGTEASLDAIRDSLVSAINTNTSVNGSVTAAAGGTGALTITADSAGTSFTQTSSAANGGATADNTATTATTTANVASTQTSTATALTFNDDGTISSPTTVTLTLSFAGGTTSSMTLDISSMTQFVSEGSDLNPSYSRNGYASSSMRSFNFDDAGNIIGVFDDNTYREIYQLALGVFANPNALEAKNGNVYAESPDSGSVTLTTAGSDGYATMSPNAREVSNVDIAEEFTKMMTTQTAYNASSTVFKTTDEMTTVARDLKR
ncbi:flagellar hook-basal body complex protein [Magnetovibrio sp. PR-2]|uniref:flagellar hook-basal body complex protein n=1 Tax=Magnetovibrio sp. PR-2 TaxID=3120356 RepID=UPI002FCE49D7